jgi:hypothetical protein
MQGFSKFFGPKSVRTADGRMGHQRADRAKVREARLRTILAAFSVDVLRTPPDRKPKCLCSSHSCSHAACIIRLACNGSSLWADMELCTEYPYSEVINNSHGRLFNCLMLTYSVLPGWTPNPQCIQSNRNSMHFHFSHHVYRHHLHSVLRRTPHSN